MALLTFVMPSDTAVRVLGVWLLSALLLFTGVTHFTAADSFRAQVPPWLPWPEVVIAASGIMEIALAVALVALPRRRAVVGWLTAAFFLAIFPGNLSQFVTGTDAFGLDSDLARAVRLLLQPVLIVWALWCTGAWRAWRNPSG